MENIISSLVALGGLAIGALSIYLAHRERIKDRTNPYREALYAKQVDAAAELSNLIHDISNTSTFIVAAIRFNDHETAYHSIGELKQKQNTTFDYLMRISPFLHSNVIKAYTKYLGYLIPLTNLVENRSYSSLDIVMTNIRATEFELIKEIRKMLGTDSLIDETIKLFEKRGLPNDDELERIYGINKKKNMTEDEAV